MPTERDFEWLREQIILIRDDVAGLKVWRDNQNAKTDSGARWTIAIMSAAIALASLLFNVWLANGGGR